MQGSGDLSNTRPHWVPPLLGGSSGLSVTGETFPALTSDSTLQGPVLWPVHTPSRSRTLWTSFLLPWLFFVGFPHLEPGWECPLSIKIAGTCEYYFTWPKKKKKLERRLLQIWRCDSVKLFEMGSLSWIIHIGPKANQTLVSLLLSHWVVSDSMLPREEQHTRLPCHSLAPNVWANTCPLSRWCCSTISSSAASSLAFRLSQHRDLFQWVGQSIGNFSFSISPSDECSGLISFRM